MINLLKELCGLNGISGREENIGSFIMSQISPFCECSVDNSGNILAFRKGNKRRGKKLMLCAHMDEVGMVITAVTDDGLLRFSPVGGIDPRVVFSSRVSVNGHLGVIGARPVHMVEDASRGDAPAFDDLYIDIGARNKSDALSTVSLFDAVTFEGEFTEFGNGLIKAKAIDDRVGCAILIDLIKSDLAFDTHFAFTVQEEVGLRGAKTAAYSVDPHTAIVIEATTAADLNGVPEHKKACKVGNGAVLSFMDNRTIYDKELFDTALELANEHKIKVQIKQLIAGGNDSGVIHTSRGGVKTLAISLPCRYLHSPVCVISSEDMKSTAQLAKVMAGREY